MAHDFDTTVGGSASTSYVTTQEADHYHENHRLHSDVWKDVAVTDDMKKAALIWATSILDDNIKWNGSIASIDQALSWPRSGVTDKEGRTVDNASIPEKIEHATADLAQLLISADRGADRETLGFSKISVGPISLEVDKYDQLVLIPDAIFETIKEFGMRNSASGTAGTVSLLRV